MTVSINPLFYFLVGLYKKICTPLTKMRLCIKINISSYGTGKLPYRTQ